MFNFLGKGSGWCIELLNYGALEVA